MANRSSGGGGGYDYVQGDEPDADEGETWYATGTGATDEGAYVYDGEQWVEQTVTSHTQLSDITANDHHDQTTAGAGLSFDSANAVLNLLFGNALATDAEGNVAVQEDQIAASNLSDHPFGADDLSVDPATQNELDSHAGNESNPHGVTHHQTGAADALTAHSDAAGAHHSQPSETQSASQEAYFTSAQEISKTVPYGWTNWETLNVPDKVVDGILLKLTTNQDSTGAIRNVEVDGYQPGYFGSAKTPNGRWKFVSLQTTNPEEARAKLSDDTNGSFTISFEYRWHVPATRGHGHSI